MHAHSRPGALIAGGLALVAAVAVLILVPGHRPLSMAGAVFFGLFALKHVALVTTLGVPAAAALRRLRPRRHDRAPATLRPDADGFWRTGEAEPHRGVLRLEHDLRALPADGSRRALVELDADKRMTLRFLADVDAAQLREGLGQRYAQRGHRELDVVARFLSPLSGTIAAGEALVFVYEAASQTTRLTLAGQSSVEHGLDFMQATWRLWFGEASPKRLVDALTRNLARRATSRA